jgi:molybdate transport system ATP-binding protein
MIELQLSHAFPNFQLEIQAHAPLTGTTALFGRSGAGKTTLLRAIAGAFRPTHGRIAIGDRTFLDTAAGIDLPIHERRIGYIFQDARLFPHLSVAANLRYGLKRAPPPHRFAVDDIVDLLGIASLLDRRTYALSGGEKQRVAIGRALLSQPSLLLMDEPLASLDPERKAELIPYIAMLRDEVKLPILYVSHAFEEIAQIADHLIVVDSGRVATSGSVFDVAADPSLGALLGRFEAGVVVPCTITAHDATDAVTTLSFAGGDLRVPRVDRDIGTRLRIRIRARDVALARQAHDDLSIANQLPGRILRVVERDAPYVDVVVDIGGTSIRALITRAGLARVGVGEGDAIVALIKTVAFDGRALGVSRRR